MLANYYVWLITFIRLINIDSWVQQKGRLSPFIYLISCEDLNSKWPRQRRSSSTLIQGCSPAEGALGRTRLAKEKQSGLCKAWSPGANQRLQARPQGVDPIFQTQIEKQYSVCFCMCQRFGLAVTEWNVWAVVSRCAPQPPSWPLGPGLLPLPAVTGAQSRCTVQEASRQDPTARVGTTSFSPNQVANKAGWAPNLQSCLQLKLRDSTPADSFLRGTDTGKGT